MDTKRSNPQLRQTRQEPFAKRILQSSRSRKTKLVLALDIHEGSPSELIDRANHILEQTEKYLCSVKFGRQTILSIGPDRTAKLLATTHALGLPAIIDDKLNDIDETNAAITQVYSQLGFDALTVNPFAGWKGGLESTFRIGHQSGMGVLPLVYMSHPGASEGYGQRVLSERSGRAKPQFEIFAEKAVEWKADGAIVGATRLSIIRRAREILGKNIPIFSPGIGTQGGDVRRALKAGTNYLIIGRSITKSSRPRKAAEKFANESISLDD